jgi:protein-S-isoprenylcysteine O-methyltransferase Ste14
MDHLLSQALKGLGQFLVFMAMLLFVPAWSLTWPEAWIFLTVFAAACALITADLAKRDRALLERRMRAGPRAETEKRQKTIQRAAAICFLATLLVPALDHRFGWSQAPIWVIAIGDGLVALGFFIIWLTFRENSFAAGVIEIMPDQRLVTTGVYSIVRHPMYSGALIMLFGVPLALGSWWGLSVFVPMTFAIIWRLIDEERFLIARLDGYAAYCARLRWRLAPGIW